MYSNYRYGNGTELYALKTDNDLRLAAEHGKRENNSVADMRFFCITFIILIVTLSIQPCQDFLAAFEAREGVKAEVTQIGELPAEEGDDCSPFCICSCCSHAVADRCVFRSIAAELVVATTELKANTYRNPYTNGFLNSIWQPPKA